MGSLSLITTTATRRRLIFVPAVTRQQKQHGQGPELGRFLRGAAPDVQGLLQVDGHQQGRHPGQERPPWSFRQCRCAHVRVRAGQPPRRGRWCLHLRQHGQDFQEKMAGDGNDPDDLIVQAFKAYDMDGKIDSKMFQHALMTWGDKMSKAEIDDIFGEFEIDEDYCIKTKEVVGLFVAVKEEEKKEPTPPPEVVEAPPAEEEDDSKKKKKKKKKAAK